MVFISRGHKRHPPEQDTGAECAKVVEVEEVYHIAKELASMLAAEGLPFVMMEDLTLKDTVKFLNTRMRDGDVAIELHKDSIGDGQEPKRVGVYVEYKSPLGMKFATLFLEEFKKLGCAKLSWIRSHTVRNLHFMRATYFTTLILELGPVEDITAMDDRSYYAKGVFNTIKQFLK